MAVADERLIVTVVYALPHEQSLFDVEIAEGASVKDAILASGVPERHPEIDLGRCIVGVYGKRVALDARIANGDRIEIYRSLIADPKASRRRRVAKRAAGR